MKKSISILCALAALIITAEVSVTSGAKAAEPEEAEKSQIAKDHPPAKNEFPVIDESEFPPPKMPDKLTYPKRTGEDWNFPKYEIKNDNPPDFKENTKILPWTPPSDMKPGLGDGEWEEVKTENVTGLNGQDLKITYYRDKTTQQVKRCVEDDKPDSEEAIKARAIGAAAPKSCW